MGEFAIEAEIREGRGKGVARRLRGSGRIPAVCYRRAADSLAFGARADVKRQLSDRQSGPNDDGLGPKAGLNGQYPCMTRNESLTAVGAVGVKVYRGRA